MSGVGSVKGVLEKRAYGTIYSIITRRKIRFRGRTVTFKRMLKFLMPLIAQEESEEDERPFNRSQAGAIIG